MIRPTKTYQRNLLGSIHRRVARAERSFRRGVIYFDEMFRRSNDQFKRLPFPRGSKQLSDWLYDE
jgi:hypothetical protein